MCYTDPSSISGFEYGSPSTNLWSSKQTKKEELKTVFHLNLRPNRHFTYIKILEPDHPGYLSICQPFLKYEQSSRRKEGQIVYGWFPLSKSLLDGINLPKGKWEFVRSWNFFQPHEELKRTLLLETIQVGGEEHSNLKRKFSSQRESKYFQLVWLAEISFEANYSETISNCTASKEKVWMKAMTTVTKETMKIFGK